MADNIQNDNLLVDENQNPINNGTIPRDNGEKNQNLQVNALGIGNVNLIFDKGNLEQIKALPQTVSSKIEAITKTLIPLIEVALIELLGSSQGYKRLLAQIVPNFNENGVFFDFVIQYNVPGYIGTDFEYSDLQSDSNYIYDRILPSNIKINKCEIDTKDGNITIAGEI